MSEEQLLLEIKSALGITGEYQDPTLKVHIQIVKNDMLESGVLEEVVNSEKALGAFVMGVRDLWTNESGKAQFSPFYIQQVVKLRNGM